MADRKEKRARIKNIKDKTENWEKANPILLDGEIGFEVMPDGSVAIKIGDGKTAWKLLKYITKTTKEAEKGNQHLQDQIDNIVLTASGDGDAAAEVAQARVSVDGTNFATLKERLDAEQNALKTDISSVENNLKLTAINGFYDLSDKVLGKYIHFSTGEETDGVDYTSSGYIEIGAADSIEITTVLPTNNAAVIVFYDENRHYICGFRNPNGSITDPVTAIFKVPKYAKYFRFSFRRYNITARISARGIIINPKTVNDNFESISETTRNIFNGFRIGYGLNDSTGFEFVTSGSTASEYIPVDFSSKEYTISGVSNKYKSFVACYDADGAYLGRTSSAERTTYILPGTALPYPNAKFIRININTANVSEMEIQVEEGTETNYIPPITATDYTARENAVNITRTMLKRVYDVRYANSIDYFNFNSYVGNSQIVHPKVLYFANGFAGHKFWMAYTPYPNGNIAYENPCIAYSDDGYNWTDISANPIDTPPSNGDTAYYSDTHLVYNSDTKKLECWYRLANETTTTEVIYRKTSSNGLDWSEKETMYTSSSLAYLLSPAIKYEDGIYKIWVVTASNPSFIRYYETTTGKDWGLIREIRLETTYDNKSYSIWHIDVEKIDNYYYMTIMCKGDDWVLFSSTSKDNETWGTPEILMLPTPDDVGWDNKLYRSCMVKVNGHDYRLYYSAVSTKGVYHTAVTTSNRASKFIGIR